ncbi:MAG: UDP-N-acetyl-D-glucosamine dehydrogenase [candidate division Zixibacteria bacterium SM23_73_3]|nr:MAG: UDP-N-acetyl-D-glucosamine dehydrogenase [candidate division Zixibacteria bacterium SM23_73_3]
MRRHNLYKTLEKKIKNRTAVVGVIGMGYVGLPLAVELGRENFKVIGIDINSHRVNRINSGKSDIDDVKDKDLKPLVKSGNIKATTNFAVLKKVDCVTICVPTPLSKTKDPDVSYILAGVSEVQKYLHPGQLVILESTTYPGSTEELILPMLEETGLEVGKDFFLAFSPERVDPGNKKYSTKNTPRVVGGITPQCTKIAKLFYEQTLTDAVPVSSTKSAEMVKLLENTFRSVNIGLVNEVALMCDRLKIDVWEIIDAANTKPFGFMPFYPGPGLGGHCIPIDPHYLSWKLKSLNYYARFIELAGDINSHMPEYVVERINRALNQKKKSLKGSKVLVLGVAYKRDIKDVRESPALDVIKLLQNGGAQVKYNDPHVFSIRMDDSVMKSVRLTKKILLGSDCVVVLADHSAYDYEFIVRNAQLVMDTRNATKYVKKNREKIVKL